MLKKLFIALICMFLFTIPVSSQEKPYQDLLDRIQKDHPEGVPQMPVMVPKTRDTKQPFVTGTEHSPLLKLYERGWFPKFSDRPLPSANPFTMVPSPRDDACCPSHHHYDSPDPIMTLITTPIYREDLTPREAPSDLFYYMWLYAPSSSQNRWPW